MTSVKNLVSHHIKTGEAEPSPLPKGAYRLYNMRYCPYAQRTGMYLARKNVPVEIVNIDLKNKPEWYFKKNPTGQVPTLEHDGKLIVESAIIPQYLDEIFPDTTVLPKDPYEKAQQKVLADRLASISTAFYALRNRSITDPVKIAENKENLQKAFEKAELALKEDFFGGKKAGYVDYMIWPFVERAAYVAQMQPDLQPFEADGFPGAKVPKMSAWVKRMMDLPEVKVAHVETEIMGKFWASHIAGDPNYDIEV